MKKTCPAMRDAFFNELFNIAKSDRRVVFITADCGAPALDRFRKRLKSQYYTVGIAEQNMISVAAGLALEGKIVYAYAIASFASLRCCEQIKVDLCCMGLPVTVLGVGAGLAYDIMGPTHHAMEDISTLRAFPNMTIFNPSDSVMAAALAGVSYRLPGPKYIRFDREGMAPLYNPEDIDYSEGLLELKTGKKVCILATGVMVRRAMEVVKALKARSIDAGLIDVYRLKPVNQDRLLAILSKYKNAVSLEEHLLSGGLGSIISEAISDNNLKIRLKRIGIEDTYLFKYGGRPCLHDLCGFDVKSLVDNIAGWLTE